MSISLASSSVISYTAKIGESKSYMSIDNKIAPLNLLAKLGYIFINSAASEL